MDSFAHDAAPSKLCAGGGQGPMDGNPFRVSYHNKVLKKAVMALVPKLGIPCGPSHSHQVTS